MTTALTFNKIAAQMAKRGVPVIPVAPKDKKPLPIAWQTKGSTEPKVILGWIAEFGNDCNAGCVATPDGFWYLDSDDPNLAELYEQETGEKFPETFTVKSRKAYHYYFIQDDLSRAMGNRKCHNAPYEFDAQVDRRQVVAPGSTHPTGFVYAIDKDIPFVVAPPTLITWLTKHGVVDTPPSKPKSNIKCHPEFDAQGWFDFCDITGDWDGCWFIPDECTIAGYKHEQSTRTGFYFDGENFGWHDFAEGCDGSSMTIGQVVAFVNAKRREKGLPIYDKPIWVQEDDATMLAAMGVEFDEPVEELEAETPRPVEANPGTVVGADGVVHLAPIENRRVKGNEEPEPPVQAVEPKPKSKLKELTCEFTEEEDRFALVVKNAADVDMSILRWVWKDRIPAGKVALFTGKPDCCKSLCLVDFVARISSGRDFPDGMKNELGAQKVLFAAMEDDLEDTLVPRLKAAGANLANVEFIYCTTYQAKDKSSGTYKPKKKTTLNLLRDAKMLLNAIKENPDIKVLALDPITSFFGHVDPNHDKEMREVMDAITNLCSKSGITVVGIIHSNKRSDVDAVHKVSGAGSIAAAARVVWGFARDSEDKTKFHMTLVKGNLNKKRTGMNYGVAEEPVTIDGVDAMYPRIQWGEELDADADDILRAERQKTRENGGDTKVDVAALLIKSSCPIASAALYRKAEDEGIAERTLKRAKAKLGIVTKLKGGHWWCYLPGTEPNEPDYSKFEEQMIPDTGVM